MRLSPLSARKRKESRKIKGEGIYTKKEIFALSPSPRGWGCEFRLNIGS
jgi:hypothetical protein